MSNDEHKDYLLFIAQDTLQEIRDSKKDQRTITFNYIVIAGVLFGVFGTLKIKFGIQGYGNYFKFIIAALAAFTIYFINDFQRKLIYYRRRLAKIWNDKGFIFAFDNEILKYKNSNDEKYYSYWRGFFAYTLVYIMIVFLVALVVCLIPLDSHNQVSRKSNHIEQAGTGIQQIKKHIQVIK